MQPKVAALMYHEVSDHPASTGFQGDSARAYKLSTALFSEHMDAVANARLTPKPAHHIDFNAPGEYLMITFDDGGVSAMYTADCLEKRGWKGHFFITTGKIGSEGWLSPQDIRELHERGHVVGSHSHTHPDPLFLLSKEELLKEYEHSISLLNDILGEPVIAASLSGGDIGRNTLSDFKAIGLPFCFTSEVTYTPLQLGNTIFIGRFCPKCDTQAKKVEDVARFKSLTRERLVRSCKQFVKKIVYQKKRVIE